MSTIVLPPSLKGAKRTTGALVISSERWERNFSIAAESLSLPSEASEANSRAPPFWLTEILRMPNLEA